MDELAWGGAIQLPVSTMLSAKPTAAKSVHAAQNPGLPETHRLTDALGMSTSILPPSNSLNNRREL